MTDPIWLLRARKEDMEREAVLRLAKLFAIAVLIGLAVIPFVFPWSGQ